MLRAYGPINTRQQGADRLVMNEDDLRRVLWQAVDPNFTGKRPSTIRLGADIILTRPIELAGGDYGVVIDGGRQFSITQSTEYRQTNFGAMFWVDEGVAIRRFSIINTVFKFTNTPSVSVPSVFAAGSGTVFEDLDIENCFIVSSEIAFVFKPKNVFSSSPAPVITNSTLKFDDNSDQWFPHTGFLGLKFSGEIFVNFYTVYTYFESTIITAKNDKGFGAKSIPDVALESGGALRVKPHNATLSNNDPTLTVGDRTTFSITCDATSTGTIQIPAGYTGQLLVLYFAAVAAGSTVKLDDTATVDVNKNHIAKKPIVDETVTFMYLNGKWRELCRSENA